MEDNEASSDTDDESSHMILEEPGVLDMNAPDETNVPALEN